MQTEIEAKFLGIDRDVMRKKLGGAGFECILPDYLMRRVVFDVPGHNMGKWARVRDEGHRIMITVKETVDAHSVTGTREIEVQVNDFESAAAVMEACGLQRKSYQETRREIWQRGDAEVVLDEWPAVPPFCEIEAPDEQTVKAVAAELGFDWNDALFGPVGLVYERQGIDARIINKHPRITFDNVDEIFGLEKKSA